MSLPKMLAAADPCDGGFRLSIGPEWLQGRTAYGGLTAALCYEAALRVADDLPPLRSMQVSFVGPASGPVTATAVLERQGRNAAFVTARLTGEKGVCTIATFVFMRDMDSHLDFSERSAPDYPRPEPIEIPPGMGPTFIQNFEIGPVEQTPGGVAADIIRWFRLKDRQGLDPMTELVLMGDGLPPAAMAVMTEQGPISSLTWLFNILAPPETTDGWWMLRATSDHAAHGASSQDMSIWNADGTLIARGMQSIAIFV
ncbi:MAG: thioesterase family protein [Pacificimonas sp.]|jgi:acyl-CoA thioesterase|nr:thioesterase family protein [Pacificimonas sp.]